MKNIRVFFKHLNVKKIVALIVAIALMIPVGMIFASADDVEREVGNIANVDKDPSLIPTTSATGAIAKGAFNYNDTWQNDKSEPIGGGNSHWVSLDFGKQVTFNSFTIQQYGRRLKQFRVQVSDDGTAWRNVFEGMDSSTPPATETWNEYFTVAFKPVTARHFRLLMEEVLTNEPTVIIGQIFIYNDAAKTTSPEIKSISNAPKELAHGLDISAYSSSSNQDAQEADKAFDGKDDTNWQAALANQQWLQVDFGSSKTVASVSFDQWSSRIKAFKIQVSEDGATWTNAFCGRIDSAAESGKRVSLTAVFPEAKTGRYFRFYCDEAISFPVVYEMRVFDAAGDAATSAEIADVTNDPVELAQGLPNGSYTASSSQSQQGPENAFDQYHDGAGNPWQATGSATVENPAWLKVDLGQVQTIARVDFAQYNNRIKDLRFQISNNGTDWSDAFCGKVENAADAGNLIQYTVVFPKAKTGRYFRFYSEESISNPAIFDMKVYDKAGSATTSEAITVLEIKDPDAPNELAHGLGNSAYSASSESNGQEADKAFDDDLSSVWQVPSGKQPESPQWLQVNFGKEVSLSRVDFTQYNNRAKLFKFQVSNDGEKWTDAFYGEVKSAADDGGSISYQVVFPTTKGQYFRMLFEETAVNGVQTQPAIFDMKVYDKAGDATTSAEITVLPMEDPNAPKELAHGLNEDSYKASSQNAPEQGPTAAFDKDMDSVWQAESTAQVTQSQWLMVNFGKIKTVSRIDFSQYQNRIKQFKLQVSDDTEVWTDVFKGNIPSAVDAAPSTNYTVVFKPVQGQYFRIVFLDMAGKAEDNTVPSMAAIFDMKVYDKAGDAETSAEIQEGLLDSEDSFKPIAPVNPVVRPENLALNKGEGAYTSSSNMEGQLPQHAFDGQGGTNWQNSGNTFPTWLQVDLGSKMDVNGLWISQWSNRIKYFKVHISDDGTNWQTAFYGRVTDPAELSAASELSIAFPTVNTRFVRFTITDGVYDEANRQFFTVPIYELEVYNSSDWKNSDNVIDVETEKPTAETLKALKEILSRIEGLNEADYTEKSFEALRKIYAEAKTYENGDKGNNTAVLEIIEKLKAAEKSLIPISSYNELRDQLKEIIKMNASDYHPDDWNSLMLLTEYANALLAEGNADTADVSFYVKSIDIMLASMRTAEEEELDYVYEINPLKSDEYIKEEIVVDGDNENDSASTGIQGVSVTILLLLVSSAAAIKLVRKKKTY